MTLLVFYGLGVLVLAGNLFAVWKGGTGERFAGALSLGAILVEQACQSLGLFRHAFLSMDEFGSLIVASGYLIVAFKEPKLLLGAAMICQSLELFAVSFEWDGELAGQMQVWSNYETALVTALLVASTILSRRIERSKKLKRKVTSLASPSTPEEIIEQAVAQHRAAKALSQLQQLPTPQ